MQNDFSGAMLSVCFKDTGTTDSVSMIEGAILIILLFVMRRNAVDLGDA